MLNLKPDFLDSLTGQGEPPLWLAITKGSMKSLEILIENGSDINQIHKTIKASPIWMAIYKRNSEAINILLSSGAKIDIPSKDGIR